MLVLDFFSWWYGPGWAGVLQTTKKRLSNLAEMFSIPILLRTIVSPWRRIITQPGAGIDAHLRAIGDNLVSRVVGFVVRFSVLVAAGVMFVGLLALALAEIILWPLVPIASVVCIVKGFL